MGNGGTIWTACIYVDYICYGRRLWGMEGLYGLHVFMWTTYVTVDVYGEWRDLYGLHVFMWTTYVTVDVYGEWRDHMDCMYLCGLHMLR